MRVEVLGPLRVERDGVPLALGARRQRALLARLVLDAGHPVSAARLVDDLWGEAPPEKVTSSLQAYVSNLRRVLEPDRRLRDTGGLLCSRDPGYLLDLTGHVLDLAEFSAAAAHCRDRARAGDLVAAREAGEQALALWRGPVLADLAEDYEFARQAADRWETERAAVTEEMLAVRVAAGDHLAALPDLADGVRRHPFRERGWELLVRALYRSGRTAEALGRLREAQRLFREELGVEPGAALLALESAVLRRDPRLEPPRREPVPGPSPREPGPADPPGRSAAPVPLGSVPPEPVAELVGRDRDVVAVADLLRRGRLVTITGPGGVGKTTLALAVGRAVRPGFPGGVFLVPLAALTDPALVLPTLARTLGVEQPTGDPFDLVRAAVGGRRVLVVLDNVEHVLPAAVDLARVLEICPSLTVLATGRSPLRLRGEREYPLAPLAAPDAEQRVTAADLDGFPAARLFLDRVAARVPGYRVEDDPEAEAVAGICRRLDGLPLALELAAAWMRVLSAEELLGRLDRALPVLADGPRDLPERQRTVRDTVAWSYRLLGPAERRLFGRLSVFRGGWTLEAAQAVCDDGADGGAAVDLVAGHAALVERSLVTRVTPDQGDPPGHVGGRGRFTMLETVREFGVEVLASEGADEEVQHRHAAFYRALADRARQGLLGVEQGVWLARLAQEHANLRAAFGWFLGHGDPDSVAVAAWGIRWFWHIRGFQAEGRRWMREALAADGLSPRGRARARLVEGQCAFGQGAWEEALATLAVATEEVAAADVDPEIAAVTAAIAGHAAIGAGDFPAAARWSERADAAYRDLDDPAGAGIAALVPVQVAAASGALADADLLLDTAEQLLRRAGGSWGIAVTLNIRVMIGQLAGQGPELLPLLHESVTRSAALRDNAAFLYGLTSLAEVLVDKGDGPVAARLFGAAESLAERTGLSMQPPASRALHEGRVARLRAELDPAVLAAAWSAGRSLSPDQTYAAAVAAST
ncbi:Predicted ATPase [Blastococcus sp. DSM 46786]|uniref:AfsR/SARP family transcriptional regulator n=1 Tax=Blastococcus sp. DSM 46786 TaxID=1798227 RepID=UPI0008B36B39|nr:BTAD domain-containing putative transcriptional regulator [Blastococcus sp. DSM 46786]SEK79652.1 Predicted ATPase [Blastococcus sp. DSM 46786]